MNPYEATLPNIAARLRAWLRGLLRLYRRPLMLIAAVATLVALGTTGALAPATSQASPVSVVPQVTAQR